MFIHWYMYVRILCVISGLHQQKLLSLTLKPLLSHLDTFRSLMDAKSEGSDSESNAYRSELILITLIYQLYYLSEKLLLNHIQNIIIILIKSISSKYYNLKLASLTLMTIILKYPGTANDYLKRHLSTLVDIFLELCYAQNLPRVRISALGCLTALTTLPFHALFPHRVKVSLPPFSHPSHNPHFIFRSLTLLCARFSCTFMFYVRLPIMFNPISASHSFISWCDKSVLRSNLDIMLTLTWYTIIYVLCLCMCVCCGMGCIRRF